MDRRGMWIILIGSIVSYLMVGEFTEVIPQKEGAVFFDNGRQYNHTAQDDRASVEPLSSQRFRNVIRQAYDYSCGSAALTTILDYYLGRNFQERQVMEGLLKFGESERIVARRGFSLLDMKRLVTALGHPSGGFRAERDDLINLDHPAIAPIEYAGFKHFVVIRKVKDNHVYVADPALGNISFTLNRFLEIWDQNVLFIVFPNGHRPVSALELVEEDMRIITEQTITHLAQKEFPVWSMPNDSRADNLPARMVNNAYIDAQGNTVNQSGYTDPSGQKFLFDGTDGLTLDERIFYDPSLARFAFEPIVNGKTLDVVEKTLHFGRK
jgi:predicted double-glycine peptidase